MKLILKEENIASLIHFVRGEKVISDGDLALLYAVPTKVLKQAVKRNIARFPHDFMFKLTSTENNSLRSQIVTLENGRGQYSKYLPMAFTEQGVAMISGILKSRRAIAVNISIMRTFVQVRKLVNGNKEIRQKIKELEKLMGDGFEKHDKKFQIIFETLKQLIQIKNEPRVPIGFKTKKSFPKKKSVPERKIKRRKN